MRFGNLFRHSMSFPRLDRLIGAHQHDAMPRGKEQAREEPCRASIANGHAQARFSRWDKVEHHVAVDQIIHQGSAGSSNVVRLGRYRATDVRCVVKTIAKGRKWFAKASLEESIFRVMSAHPNVVDLYDVFEGPRQVHLVMERFDGGDLVDLIEARRGRLAERETRSIMRQLGGVVRYMHEHRMAHLDIKPSNILVRAAADGADDVVVKLIDFGASSIVRPGRQLHAPAGSPTFMAPEVAAASYNVQADMWSIGVVLFICHFGYNPFNPQGFCYDAAHRHLYTSVRNRFRNETRGGFGAFFPQDIAAPDALKALIASLLDADPHRRPTAEQFLAHPSMTVLGDDDALSPSRGGDRRSI